MMGKIKHVPNHQPDSNFSKHGSKHGSLNVPMFHITQPLGIWSIMATIFGDVQYTQNGTFTNPCKMMIQDPRESISSSFPRRGVDHPISAFQRAAVASNISSASGHGPRFLEFATYRLTEK